LNKISFFLVFIFIISLVIFKNYKGDDKYITLKETSVILAFGDSLSYGFGADYEFSYPKQMEIKTGLKIINAGVNGEVSAEGLRRLPSFLETKVDLVILCHGGNDILKNLPSEELKNNLLAMINIIHGSGAKVLLVGVPDFSLFGLEVHDIYQEVAEETDVVFENDVLKKIGMSRSLKSDYVHPNEKGYEAMADAFIEILKIQ